MIESFFKEIDQTYPPEEPKSQGEKVVQKAEQEFRGFSEEHKSRQQEMKDIRAELKKLKRKFRRFKNVRNSRLVEVNKRRSEKRAEIKKKIEILGMRMQEIKLEG